MHKMNRCNGTKVNCVGRMYDYPSELSKVSVKLLWSLLNLNIGAMVTMSRIVIDRMKQRKQGIIVNISSGSELQPMPYATVYAATKVNFTFLCVHSRGFSSHMYISSPISFIDIR